MFTLSTAMMKRRLGVPKNRPLADFLPRVTTAGKAFAAEITNFNIEARNLKGESEISDEHEKRNRAARQMMLDAGIVPENLPPAEDVKKVGRRVRKDEKSISKERKDQTGV